MTSPGTRPLTAEEKELTALLGTFDGDHLISDAVHGEQAPAAGQACR